MNKIAPWILMLCMACGGKNNIPDVSHIPVDCKIERFDLAFFATDTNNIARGLYQLNQQFPYFFTDFTANILGVGVLSDTSTRAFAATRQFLTSYLPVEDSLKKKYAQTAWLEKELKRSFQFVKYYFPAYKLPQKVVTYTGPFDAAGVAITAYALGIGLQLYAGSHFSFYNSLQGQEMYPAYISRRFEPAYIDVNCMMAIAQDIYPDKTEGRNLIEKMIEKGKYWYLVNLFLPETDDSLLTGFTQDQLSWCKSNEGLIWNFLLQSNTELYSIEPDVIKNYIGDAPGTPGMPAAAPGNIGQWVGWQIVKKYVANHPSGQPRQLLETSAKEIFDDTKYKPR